MSIDDYITSIDDTLDNLIHDNIQKYVSDYKKMNVYNNNIKIPLQKIWLLTPKLKMCGKMYKQKQSINVSLILYELDPVVKKFRMFIDNLETKVLSILETKIDNKVLLKSCIKSTHNFFPVLILQLPINKHFIFDNNNEPISYEDVVGSSFVTACVELCDVWLNDEHYGINLNVLQMKVYPEFDFTVCIFDNIKKTEMKKGLPPPMKKVIDKPKVIEKEKEKEKESEPYKISDEASSFSFVPSIKDLLSIKKSLKSIKVSIHDEISILDDLSKQEIIETKQEIIETKQEVIELPKINDVIEESCAVEEIIAPRQKKRRKKSSNKQQIS